MDNRKIFWTSDLHFNAERTLVMSKRPFDTVPDMNDNMIRNWNKTVGKEDVVYILGDFGDYSYAQYLNGHKILIPGNYDRTDEKEFILSHDFIQVTDDKFSIEYRGYKINMVHEPKLLNRQYMEKDEINLFGHVHKLCMVKPFGLNVGTDCHNFTPIDFDTILFYAGGIREYYDFNVFM